MVSRFSSRWTSAVFSLFVSLWATATGYAETVRTQNFIIEAPSRELAEEFADLAEKYRKEKAMEWLGREMPRWPSPCPLRVIPIRQGGAEGATTFNFGEDTRKMWIRGPLNRLKDSVLPHEITHTVFAHYFRQPVPRWADEGGSVYSEDDLERRRHDKMVVQYLNAGKAFTLNALFALEDYPTNPVQQMVLYAEGYSISKYLIEGGDRRTFLMFVGDGMRMGWNRAIRKHYKFQDVNELEKEWIAHLHRVAKGEAKEYAITREPVEVVKNTQPQQGSQPEKNRLVVRQSGTNEETTEGGIVARGLAPNSSQERTQATERERDFDRRGAAWNDRPVNDEPAPARFERPTSRPSLDARPLGKEDVRRNDFENRPTNPVRLKEVNQLPPLPGNCPNGQCPNRSAYPVNGPGGNNFPVNNCPNGQCNNRGPVILMDPEWP